MSTLRDLALQISYGPHDDRLRDFFIRAMAASVRYDRAVGYFSSTMLAVAAAGVTRRMKMRLALPESDYVANRLKALAWLVGTGQLEIKVVLPTDGHGNPLPAGRNDCYDHPKEGLFELALSDGLTTNASP